MAHKTIGDLNHTSASSAPATHVYDRDSKKIYTASMHGHLRAVRADIADGKPVWIPRATK
jgi:hypothetical protein